MKRFFLAGLCLALLAGCATTSNKKLAGCKGKYEPINAPDKYLLASPESKGSTP